MSLRTDPYYRDLARGALRDAGVVEPPVTVESVAQHIGVPIYVINLPAWFSGAIIYEDGMPVILVNSAVGEIGMRRAMGHSIGHILVVLDDSSAGYPRDDPDHRAADVISEELTVPGDMVVEQSRKWFNDHRYLARLFGVSEEEMLAKMRDLGLIKSRGITWDY
jgi:Zn-dependent peptidase ImmA (M78 family)